MMATSRVLIGALSQEVRDPASAAAATYARLGETCDVGQSDQYQALGALVQGLERIASSGLRVAASRDAVLADLGTVLDDARIVIEPGLREADVEVLWDVNGDLPLVQADHHSLLQVFVNLARNSLQALENCARREVAISAALEKDLGGGSIPRHGTWRGTEEKGDRALPSSPPVFTERQRRVLRFVLEGLSNKEIAFQLQIPESYVKAILQGLFRKTGVRTRDQLVRVAVEQYEDQL